MSQRNAMSLDKLHLIDRAKKDLSGFIDQIASFYGDDLLSITAFGSRVSGDQIRKESDLNLLVIYSDLNIADLGGIAALARKLSKKYGFSPRFLSRRNLAQSSKCFPLDLLGMKDDYLVLFGSDVLAEIDVSRPDLRFQLAYEIKKMRMRIKQQFWRAAGDRAMMTRIVSSRFSSLIYLTKGLLYFKNGSAPRKKEEILSEASTKLGLNAVDLARLKAVRDGSVKPDAQELRQCFARLMDMIRVLDETLEKLPS
jgi:predicted nucleotidyltransferase